MEFAMNQPSGFLGDPDQFQDIDDAFINNILESSTTINDESLFGSNSLMETDISLPFAEFEDITEVNMTETSAEESKDTTQDLIEKMEEFLCQHEDKFDIKEEQRVDQEAVDAEKVLDALMSGQINYTTTQESQNQQRKQVTSANINHVSECIMPDGRNAIIIITGPSMAETQSTSIMELNDGNESGSNPDSPNSSYLEDQLSTYQEDNNSFLEDTSSTYQEDQLSYKDDPTNDSDWSPVSSVKSSSSIRGVRKYKKTATRKAKYTMQVKKERKKWQNVEAARRYRDKKKAEYEDVELEVKMLEDKNKALNDVVKTKENELTTLKKLMTELGLIKV